MKKRRQTRLPVLMHHLVSNDTSHIAVTPANFEAQCRIFAENGLHGVGLDEAEDFLLNGTPLPEKSFLMTFDDGFLDNYVYAWPIMRNYGHKGVVFAVADRVDQAQKECAGRAAGGSTLRPTVEDVWAGRCAQEDLPEVDRLLHTGAHGHTVRRDLFFNWDEARLMEQSGIMAVAGHSAAHESVFTGPAFSGFTQPGDRTRITYPNNPPLFWGLPRFDYGAELANRAFIPSPELVAEIKKLVPQDEAEAGEFFRNPAAVAQLRALVARYEGKLGDFESREEMIARMGAVMARSQETLTRELGHRVKSFCWPWGNFCGEARECGLAAGFEVFYTTSLGMNPPGAPLAVHRFKVKDRHDDWLLRRTRLYSRPLMGALYLKLRI